MITTEQAQTILDRVVPYGVEDVVYLRQRYGSGFVDSAIDLMRKLGGSNYFDDAVRQLARAILQPPMLVYTRAKEVKQYPSRFTSKRIPMSILAHKV
jgi:hypothetical protein